MTAVDQAARRPTRRVDEEKSIVRKESYVQGFWDQTELRFPLTGLVHSFILLVSCNPGSSQLRGRANGSRRFQVPLKAKSNFATRRGRAKELEMKTQLFQLLFLYNISWSFRTQR